MDGRTDVEDWNSEDIDPYAIATPPMSRFASAIVLYGRVLLRYMAIVLVACAIGYGIVFVQQSGQLTTPSAALKSVKSAPGAVSAEKFKPQPTGYYIEKDGTYVTKDGLNFEKTSDPPPNSSLPVYTKVDGNRVERTR